MLRKSLLTGQFHCGPESSRLRTPTHSCGCVHTSFLKKHSCLLSSSHNDTGIWQGGQGQLRERELKFFCSLLPTRFPRTAEAGFLRQCRQHTPPPARAASILWFYRFPNGRNLIRSQHDSPSVFCTITLHIVILSLPYELFAITWVNIKFY